MTAGPNPLGLSQLEIASHLVSGRAARPPALERRPSRSARAALERAVLRALLRPPCVVSFSGGRDSSAVLAVAVHVARREGLDAPVPVTIRFPGIARADEAAWQEQVIRHAGVRDWERIEVGDELDMLGPYARDVLRRCGLLWPANSYVHEPILRRATGGSLVTGADGDGLLGAWRWQRHADVLAGRRRRTPRDLAALAHALSPPALRRLRVRRHPVRVPAWLKPEAARDLAAAQRREMAGEPFVWGRRVRWYAERRFLALLRAGFETMGAVHDVAVTHLLNDPAFLAAMAQGPVWGPGGRTAAMEALFGDLLPPAVTARADKAWFGDAYGRGYSRAFTDRWSGEGIDPTVVDAEVLAQTWREDADPGRQSMLLLHSIWLSSEDGAR